MGAQEEDYDVWRIFFCAVEGFSVAGPHAIRCCIRTAVRAGR
ncbi:MULTISPECIES: hypothetical protein [Corynebacterium]|uniref:Uncharacterized protein n=1 Tax=Corynebacterium glucuronolyticum ATCC 51866 TaxID=548478 RepID=A0ABP2DTK9_9CORY|nr:MULTISPECIES: hypothetical protein [Corynebacterium]EEI28310.1 hypothetical protein HMPREF0294_0074 [Corynebacterium glucuronolyticum ATCC 51867]EEI63329.1 hypothetical protein HMPREF0293_1233 [Corynebacterium glucuronolyticum ATCC 51866]WKD62945.1 hypothetical protein CGLUCO_03335 [Corynebacterium glucuronolyticum DSM 44120]SMB85428.1 hypothetical protein SAMN05660745_01436 [Corynebacterium glucuronolyticum]